MQKKREKGENPKTNRRWFINHMAKVGGVSALASSGLLVPIITEASNLAQRPELRPDKVRQFKQALSQIKATGKFKQVNKSWVQPLKDMSPVDRVAAVTVMEFSNKNPHCPDIGTKAATVVDMSTLRQEAWGFGCGAGCSGATGGGCGMSCMNSKDPQFKVDPMGIVVLESDVKVIAKDPSVVGKAMYNAATAYKEVFG